MAPDCNYTGSANTDTSRGSSESHPGSDCSGDTGALDAVDVGQRGKDLVMRMVSNERCRAAVLAGPAAQEAVMDSVAIKNNTEGSWKEA